MSGYSFSIYSLYIYWMPEYKIYFKLSWWQSEKRIKSSDLKYKVHITNIVSSQLKYSCIFFNNFMKYETIKVMYMVQAHIRIPIMKP